MHQIFRQCWCSCSYWFHWKVHIFK